MQTQPRPLDHVQEKRDDGNIESRSLILEQKILPKDLSDDEVGEEYQEIPLDDLEFSDESEVDLDESFDKAIQKLQQKHFLSRADPETFSNEEIVSKEIKPETSKRPETVDDFIRNFLVQKGMYKALDVFQNEWYEKLQTGQIDASELSEVMDVHQHNYQLDQNLMKLSKEVDAFKSLEHELKGTYEKLRKERDHHRLHHNRVVQEKIRLANELKLMTRKYESLLPTLKHWQQRYELLMKEKSLLSIDRERLQEAVQNNLSRGKPNNYVSKSSNYYNSKAALKDSKDGSRVLTKDFKSSSKDDKKPTIKERAERVNVEISDLPIEDRPNIYKDSKESCFSLSPKAANLKQHSTIKAHSMAVSSVKWKMENGTKKLYTASDDRCWRAWSIHNGEMITSGVGHKDWIGEIDLHPRENLIATASGDGTLKLWNSLDGKCVKSFNEHLQAVWSCAFHDAGDYVATGSMDQTSKLFDIRSSKCRVVLRGHSDSVNHVFFKPFSNDLWSCSGDKTLSGWDIRSGLCVQTLYGHLNAVVHGAFAYQGNVLASCDLDGCLKLWDIRQNRETKSIEFGSAAHKISFDTKGETIAVALANGECALYDVYDDKIVNSLISSQKSLQSVSIDLHAEHVAVGGSDGTVQLWI